MFDRIRLFRLVSTIHKNSVCKLTDHRTSKVAYLINKRFGHIKEPTADGVIFDLSSLRPSELESLILADGLDFCILFLMPDREKVFADIEVLYSQLVLSDFECILSVPLYICLLTDIVPFLVLRHLCLLGFF